MATRKVEHFVRCAAREDGRGEKKSQQAHSSFARRVICQAVIAALSVGASFSHANPTAPTVVNGTATITNQSNTLTIKNSPNTIINWRSFSINSGEITRFLQESASSQVLNRVTGVDPSVILGALQSNGRVFLINPNGIAFGQGAQVNVAGLVASTLNLSNENFLAGKLKFDPQQGAGKVSNEGAITVDKGGQVIIVAPQIENSGIIRAPEGDILLAAGRSANLVDLKNPEISIEIKAPADRVLNVGQLIAKNISLYGALVENSGRISATTAVIGEGGRISLRAKTDVTTTATSRITADGPSAGSIIAQAESGVAAIAGTLSAQASAAPGGTVEVAALRVTVNEGARISASGTTGGGKVVIGGDAPAALTTPVTQTVEVAPTARIQANARRRGSGGEVVIRSQTSTRVFGTVEARGSRESGVPFGEGVTPFILMRRPGESSSRTGGSEPVESSVGTLVVDGTIDALTRAGTVGTKLLSADVLKKIGMVQAVDAAGSTVTLQARNVRLLGRLVVPTSSGKGGSIQVLGGAVTLTGSTLDASGGASGGTVSVTAQEGLLLADGKIEARSDTGAGGAVSLNADVLMQAGEVRVDGTTGGTVAMQARNILSAGRVDASASLGPGGEINLQASAAVVQTSAAQFTVDGTDGGHIRVQAGDRVFSSATLSAVGGGGKGGAVEVLANEIVLRAAAIDASGDVGGGTILVGGDLHGANPAVSNAMHTAINWSTTLNADAKTRGDGGKVIVWSNDRTEFYGKVAARGGAQSGDGGFIEVSGKETLTFGGLGDAGATNGKAGTLLLDPKNIIIDASASSAPGSIDLVDPHIGGNDGFAQNVTVLPNGNIVATDPRDGLVASSAGAVYLFNGASGALISSLNGSTAGDQIGLDGVTVLTNGNFVVRSMSWHNGAATNVGAVTFGTATGGISGTVSSANSLVGSVTDDRIGIGGITALSNGNYIVNSYFWSNGAAFRVGAVTWGSGTAGVQGTVSAANSLVGTTSADTVGGDLVVALNNGNYVVRSGSWFNATTGASTAGAVTWASGTTGITGAVSASNSLVGTRANDHIGGLSVTALPSGNYVVVSPGWGNGTTTGVGAVTWASGATGITGTVSAANSLVGNLFNDAVGSGGVTVLTNGNYVVMSPDIFTTVGTGGAVTWASGTTGITGAVSAANSLVGSTNADHVGSGGVTALTNGNYVVLSPSWHNGGAVSSAGAATWGSGTGGIAGAVSASNSLVGTTSGDQVGLGGITALTNGNYVVRSQSWNNGAATEVGAVTWGSGTAGITGAVSASNSLVGTTTNDRVGVSGVTALTNGNYVVSSWQWNNGAATLAGAVTWGSGTAGVTGAVSASNSLVGTVSNDRVGIDGVTALTNGNYVVNSSQWNNGAAALAGAVTWGSGTSGIVGAVSAANSLVGTTTNDRVGANGITALNNGNYVVRSDTWDNAAIADAGAVTWGSGTAGISGAVSASNSLVGSTASDQVGSGGVTALSNGNYVVRSVNWDSGAVANVGAVTWGSGTTGITGAVSAGNSLVGTTLNDNVGGGGIVALPNGNYVAVSRLWDSGAVTDVGAVTWGSGTIGVRGAVSTTNSLIGTTTNDQFGNGGITALSNGNFVVNSPVFNNGNVDTGKLVIYVPGGALANPLAFTDNSAGNSTISPSQITAITNTGTGIVLQANNDITLNASSPIVTSASGSGGAITMQAGRSITLASNITTDNGALTLVANETSANGVITANRDAGAAAITIPNGITVNAGTGNVTMTVADGAGRTGTFATAGNIAVGNGATISGGRLIIENSGNADVVLGTATLQSTATGLPGTTPAITLSTANGNITSSATTATASGGVNIGAGSVTVNTGTIAVSSSYEVTNSTTVNGGTLSLNVASNTGSLTMSNGTLSGTGNLTVMGSTALSGGTMSGTGSTITQGALTITGNGINLDAGRVLDVRGGASWSGGFASINLNPAGGTVGSGSIINRVGSTFDANGTGNSLVLAPNQGAGDDGSNALFTNLGSFIKSAGAGVADIRSGLTNNGTMQVNSGTLLLSGSSTHTSASLTGAGTVEFGGGTHTLDAGSSITTTNATFSSGTTTVSGTYNVSGATSTAGGSANLTGTLTSLGTALSVNGNLNLGANAATVSSLTMLGSTLSGTGTVTVSGATTLSGGTMSGTGSTITQGALTINSNGISLDAGRVLDVRGGASWSGGFASINLNPSGGTVGSGSIINRVGSTFDANGTGNSLVLAPNQGAGDDGSNALFTNLGSFIKSAGVGVADIRSGLTNNGTMQVNSGTLLLSGSSTHTTSASLTGAGTVEFGGGTHTLDVGSSITTTNATFSSGTTTVSGTYNVSGTTSTAGGSANLTGTLTSLGTALSVNGNLNLGANAATVSSLTMLGSTLSGTGTVTVSGATTLSGGTMSGTGSTITLGAVTINGNGINLDAGRVLDIRGGASWAGGISNVINLNPSGGAVGSGSIVNRAGSTFDSNGSGNSLIIAPNQGAGDDGSSAAFTNFGTFTKSAGAGTTEIRPAFANNGTLQVQSGTLQVNAFPTNAGVIDIVGGSTFSTNGSGLGNNGTIQGSGTLNLGGSLLTNNGTLRAGNSPGALNITGNLALTSTSVVEVEIQSPGTTAGTDYDVINVSGSATLNGALNVSHLGGFSPIVGNNFTPLTYASRSGDFTAINAPSGFTYGGTPNATNYLLSVTALGGGTNTWIGTTGLWETAGNWSQGHVPTAVEDVVIPDRGTVGVSETITVSAAAQNARRLTSAENVTVASGGALTIATSTSSTSGALNISGGTLTNNSALTANALNVSSGTLNGSGTVTLQSGSSTWTGGTISGTGLFTVASGATLAISGGSLKVFDGRTLNNAGTVTLGGGDLQMQAGAVVNNQATGVFDIQSDTSVLNGGSAGAFNNAGTLTKSGSTGGFTRFFTVFNNDGVLQNNTGTLTIGAGGTHNGTFNNVDALEFCGAPTFVCTGGANVFSSTSSIGGAGNVYFTSVTAAINGSYSPAYTEIRPGSVVNFNQTGTATTGTLNFTGGTLNVNAGSLAITGNANVVNGTLNVKATGAANPLSVGGNLGLSTGSAIGIELAGTGAGQFGKIAVTGSAALSGTMNVTHSGGFTPTGGNTFTILTYGSSTGDFTAINSPSGFTYAPTLNPTSYVLAFGSGSTNTWIGTSGLWQTGSNWSLGHTPTASEDAVIPDVGAPGVSDTITVSAAGQTARRVTSAENLTIGSGALTLGSGNSTTSAPLTVSGGTLTVNGPLAAATLNLSGGTLNGSDAITVSNAFNWTGGVLAGTGTLVTQAGSVNTLAPAFATTASLRGSRVWNNAGTVTFTPNVGQLSYFEIDDTTADGTAIFNNQAGALFNLNASYTDSHIQGVGTFNNAGELRKTLNTTAALSAVQPNFNNQAGGVVNVNSGTLRLDSSGTDAGNYQVASGATLHFNSFNSNRSISGNISGAGDVVFAKQLTGNTTYTLTGDYNVSGTTTVVLNELGAGALNFNGTVTNLGTSYTQSGSVGTVSFTGITGGAATGFRNVGAMAVNGGNVTFANGTSFSGLTNLTRGGTGTLDLGNASIALSSLTMNEGTVTSTGNISVSAAGAFNWNGGVIGGSGLLTTPSGLTTSLSPGFAQTASLRGSRVWNNAGTVTFTPNAGTLSFFQIDDTIADGTAAFNNQAGGVFNLNASYSDAHITGVGAFNNAGILSKNLNTAAATSAVLPNFTNQAGGVVNVNSGTLRLDSGGTDAGNYQVASGATLHFNTTDSSRSISGNITSAGTVIFAKPLTSVTTYTLTGDYNASNVTTVALDELGTGTLNFNGTVTNLGTTYTQSGSSGTVSFAGITGGASTGFQNLSVMTMNGGNATFANGTNFSGLANLTRAGNGTLDLANNSISVAALTVSGGTVTGSGNVTVGPGGVFNWTNGVIAGSGTLTTNATATTTLAPGFAQTASLRGSRVWNNSGTVTFTPNAGTISFFEIDDTLADGTAVFNNQTGALFNLNASTSDIHIPGVGTFNNLGELRKNLNTSPSTSRITPAFNNLGTLSVNSGTLQQDGAFTQTGTLNLASGSTFRKTGGFSNDGLVAGVGTIDVGSGTFNNNGTLRAGTSPGTLNIIGNLAMSATSVTEVELQSPGTTAGTDYDVINVTGSAALNGSLNVTHLGGFTPTAGSNFTILNYGSRSGDFTTIGSPIGYSYGGAPGATSYVITAALASTNTWIGTSGPWETASNWSFGHTPTASEDAIIPDVGAAGVSNTITISTAGQTARRVASAENLTIGAGSLTLGSGNSSTNAPLSISGGTLTADGALAASTLNLSSGTLNGSGAVTVSGTMNWTGGSLAGSGQLNVANGAVMNINGTSDMVITGRTLNNAGTINWLGSGSLRPVLSAAINNQSGGLFNIQNDLTMTTGGGLGSSIFTNAAGGIVRKLGSNGTTTIGGAQGPQFVNAGTVEVQSGTLALGDSAVSGDHSSTGTFTLSPGTSFAVNGGTLNLTGANVVSGGGALTVSGGTLNVGGALTASALNLSSGTLTGSGSVTLSGTMNWTGGSLAGAGQLNVANGAVMNINGTSDMVITGRTVNNAGTINWLGSGPLRPVLSAAINNQSGGLFNIQNDLTMTTGGGLGSAVFSNAAGGIVRKSGSSGTTTIGGGQGPQFVNAGTVEVQSGTLALGDSAVSGDHSNSGTMTFSPGTNFVVNGGTVNLTSTSVTNGAPLTVSGGTINIDGALTASALTVNGGTGNFNAAATTVPTVSLSSGTLGGSGGLNVSGVMNWTGGSISGAGQLNVANGAVMNINGTSGMVISGRTINNAGTMNWLGTGDLQPQQSATINNQSGGLFLIQNDLTMSTGGGLGSSVFTNAAGGTVRKSGSSGTTTIGIGQGPSFSNAGTIDVQSGTLAFGTISGFTTNAGTINVASGAVLSTSGNALTNTGTIQGGGTINLGSATLTSSGTLRAGTSPGTLNISGNLAMTSTSITEVEIQPPGATAGTDYDLINVTGSAALAGTLNVTHLGGFTPTAGSNFTILNYASSTGDFTTKNFPGGFGYTTTANPTAYVLGFGVSTTNTWIATSGLWETAANWSLGHAPTANETAVIPDVGAPGISDTITVSAAAQNAGKLTALENVAISNGNLTLGAGPSQVNAALAVTGGTLTANGALAANSVSLSNGTLGGTGNITLTSGPFSVAAAGGTINGLSVSAPAFALAGSLAVTGGTLNTAGTTQINAGRQLSLNSSTLNSAGPIAVDGTLALLNGAGLGGGGAINVGAGGTLEFIATSLSLTQPLNSLGTVRALGGSTVSLSGGGALGPSFAADSTSTLNFAQGLFTVPASGASLTGAGTVRLSGATFAGSGSISNAANLDLTATTSLPGGFSNSGNVRVLNGTFSTASTYTQTAGSTLLSADPLAPTNLTAGGAGVQILGGTLGGSGTVTGMLTLGTATLSPGASPGSLHIAGDLALNPASSVLLEIASMTAGTGYDVIRVDGNAALAGTLELRLLGGFVPTTFAGYNPFSFASATGNFGATILPANVNLIFGLNGFSAALANALSTPISSDSAFLQDVRAEITRSTTLSGIEAASIVNPAILAAQTEQPIFYEKSTTPPVSSTNTRAECR